MGADGILNLLRVAGELLLAARANVRTSILTAFLTAVFLGLFWTALVMVRAGSFMGGLHAAWTPAGLHDSPAVLQDELRAVAANDRAIRQVLSGLLERSPGASRVRLAVIHNGVTGLSGIGLLRFDVTNMVAAPGRDPGPLTQNQPLANWSEYLSTLLAGQCALVDGSKMANAGARARMESMNIHYFLACPVIDPAGQMLGGAFISWDGNEQPPVGQTLKSLMDVAREAGRQIALALDLRAGR